MTLNDLTHIYWEESEPTISQWNNGTYAKSTDIIFFSINKYVEVNEDNEWRFFEYLMKWSTFMQPNSLFN